MFAQDHSKRRSEGATRATFLFADLCGFNAAARIADVATPGGLLMIERARGAVGDAASFEMVSRGLRELRGLPDASVHAVVAA
jgi:class 3 adenylate cyclase